MKPLLLHYYVTTRCNARCAFCRIWEEPATLDASLDDVEANLTAARKAGCKFVDFTGGEPLLNAQLPAFLRTAQTLGFCTSVTTNCLLFPARVKELAGLIDLLHFSIDADTAELHDALRGKRSFHLVLESIDLALQNRLVPDLLFTYTDDNIAAFEGVYRLGREKKIMVILDPVFDIDGPDQLKASTHAKAQEYGKRPGVYLNRAHLTLRKRGGNHTDNPLCRVVDSTIVILPGNQVALPCFHHRQEIIPIKGNLDEIRLGDQRRQAAQQQGRYSFCEECHINCYFDPSFSFMRNRLFVQSTMAKVRYAWQKYIIYKRARPLHFP
jgi:MoaA/NifB/PqqE/SkfB family radical SAM enzyme